MTSFYYFLRYFTQPAYRIRGVGLGRMCELIRRVAAKYAPPEPLIVENFRGDARFKCFLREHMGGQIFFRGSYSGDQLTIIENLLNTHSTFIDAGANQGEFSIAAARIARQGKIIAFEPVAEYGARLLENTQLNGFKNIQLVPVALGEHEDALPIYDATENYSDGTRNEGLPTLFSLKSRSVVREVVPVKRLDDILQSLGITRVDVIKLDIEGAEWMALRGAVNTLANCRPILILEVGRETCRAAGHEPEALVAWLANQGYRIEKVMEGGTTQAIDLARLSDFQNVVAYPV